MGERSEGHDRYDERRRTREASQRPEHDIRHEVARRPDDAGERRVAASSEIVLSDHVRSVTPDEAAQMKLEPTGRRAALSPQHDGAHGEEITAEAGRWWKAQESEAVDRSIRHDSSRRLSPDEAARLKIKGADAAFEPVPDQLRKESAVRSIRDLEDFSPEKWREMSMERRRVALNRAGRALMDAYDCPNPPLITRELPEDDRTVTLGEYEDGATIHNLQGDYALRVNEKLLQDDDPREALKTYIHEFRHAYQSEMATRYEKPQFRNWVHEPEAAAKWSEARRGGTYVRPEEDYEKYRRQGVEQDARDFAEELIRRVYE